MNPWTISIPSQATLAQTAPRGWWWDTLLSGPALTLLAVAGGCVLLLVLMGWRLRRLSAPVRAARRAKRGGESGVATIEFVLIAPFLLTITLILIQTMLVFTGLFYVNYAAYAAARSAIVYIPADMGVDGPNMLTPVEGRLKYDRVRAAAIIAVMPVSGQEAGGLLSAPAVVAALNDYYAQQGRSAPGWVDNLAQGRLNYAAQHTTLTLMTVEDTGNGRLRFDDIVGGVEVGAKDAVAVEVEHEFALTVPVASQIFQLGGRSGSYTPQTRGASDTPAPPGAWTLITARAVLTNEGIDRNLPDPPRVPRR